jgi:hypothetical protein
MTIMKYELHPACCAWPQVSDKELQELAADVRANGLHEPLTLTPDGLLLDGRNRMLACEIPGVTPATIIHAGEPVLYSLIRNKHRRHMSVDQIALAAARLVTTEQGMNQHEVSSNEPTSIAAAAKAVGVPETAIKSARTVLRDGTDEEIGAVKRGEAKLRTTAETIRDRTRPPSPVYTPPVDRPPVYTPPPASSPAGSPEPAEAGQAEQPPKRVTLTLTIEINAGEEERWQSVLPGKDAIATIEELLAELNGIEETHSDLLHILTTHGLDWYPSLPGVRIVDGALAAEWHAQAQISYAEGVQERGDVQEVTPS